MISPDDPSPSPPPATEETTAARTGIAASAVSARPDVTQLTLMLVGGAGILAGIAVVLALTWLRGDAPIRTAAAASPTTAPAPATRPEPAPDVDPATAPKWTGQRKAVWAYDGTKTIAFELQATHDVPVWMSRARPTLVVRCLSRSTEAFVVLGTSATIEEDSYKRSIRLQWDDGPEAVQQWQASDSAQELFAPDGVAFVRQLAHATRLRFGFTPFNAPPATAEFAVRGFDQLAGLVAGACRWKL